MLKDKNFEGLFEEYIKLAPNEKVIHYWDLPDGFCVRLNKPIKDLPFRGSTNSITIGKLKRNFGNDFKMEKNIKSILNWRNKRHEVNVKFPLNLVNKEYVEIYSLMLSEGSYNKGFILHVPEEEFHNIFFSSLNRLFVNVHINQILSKGFKLSFAPNKLRYLLPFPKHIPKFILTNREFARTYLKIAFEAESNPFYKLRKGTQVTRRIKLSRNVGIDNLIKEKLPYKEGERIYFGTLKKDFPKLASKILKNPCSIILGEKIMLKKHFDIDVSLSPEYLRINKTYFRRGKVSAKWTLTIHSININKFIKEIGFITPHKNDVAKKMLNVRLQRPKYFALNIMRKAAYNKIFDFSKYKKEMFKLGYKFPRVFISKYMKKNLIKKVGPHSYEILNYSL